METWKTIVTETIRQAQDGSLSPQEGATLLGAIADALEAVWEGELLPDRVWVTLAVKGALAVLRETASNLEAIPDGEE